MLRILKFDTKIGYDKFYCVLKNQQHMAYQSLYFVHFSFFSNNFSNISAQHELVLESSNFIYTMKKTKCITVNKIKVLRFTFFFFFSSFPFSTSHSKVMNICKFLSKISQELLDLGFEIWYKYKV